MRREEETIFVFQFACQSIVDRVEQQVEDEETVIHPNGGNDNDLD